MFEKYLISLVIGFVMRQLAKFVATVDWATVKIDAAVRIAAVVPGEWFDAEAVAVANALIDGVQAVLSSTAEWEKIINLLATSKFTEAGEALLELLAKQWKPDPQNLHALKAQAACLKLAA